MKLLDLSYFRYINLISVWTCILILDRPQIKEPFYCIHRTNLHVGYYGLIIVRPQTFNRSQGNIEYPYWMAFFTCILI